MPNKIMTFHLYKNHQFLEINTGRYIQYCNAMSVLLFIIYVTQYNKRDIMSTFENIEILALSNRRFYKLSNDTEFIHL